MQRIRRASSGLPSLALLGFLALGCSQGEGDRCQIHSDCASGLECRGGESGNGVCVKPGTSSGKDAAPDTVVKPVSDAAPDTLAQPDAASDAVTPDAAPDGAPDTAERPAPDASLDLPPAGPEVGLDGAAPDAPAADSTVPRAPDAAESEAGALDATPFG
jgi:hypothetical protein